MNGLTEEHMTLNSPQDKACAVAQAHFNAHVAQEHIDAINLEMQLVWRHSWWNQSVQKLLWDYHGMTSSLHHRKVHTVAHDGWSL